MLVSANNHYLASLRGRVGWVAGPWLLYATGGAAWTNTSYTATATGLVAGAVFLPGIGATTSFSDTNTGWVAGGGVEWMLTPNWLLARRIPALRLLWLLRHASPGVYRAFWCVPTRSLQLGHPLVGPSV